MINVSKRILLFPPEVGTEVTMHGGKRTGGSGGKGSPDEATALRECDHTFGLMCRRRNESLQPRVELGGTVGKQIMLETVSYSSACRPRRRKRKKKLFNGMLPVLWSYPEQNEARRKEFAGRVHQKLPRSGVGRISKPDRFKGVVRNPKIYFRSCSRDCSRQIMECGASSEIYTSRDSPHTEAVNTFLQTKNSFPHQKQVMSGLDRGECLKRTRAVRDLTSLCPSSGMGLGTREEGNQIMNKRRVNQYEKLRSGMALTFVERFKMECERLAMLQQKGPIPRTIWNARPKREEDLFGPSVLILKRLEVNGEDNQLLVAEVSDRLDLATESDVVLLPNESGLPFTCIVQTANTFWTNSKWLKEPLGEIEPSLWTLVLKFCSSPEDFDYHISPLDYEFPSINGFTMMKRAGIISGLPFTDESDPRLVWVKESIEKCHYLFLNSEKARRLSHQVDRQAID